MNPSKTKSFKITSPFKKFPIKNMLSKLNLKQKSKEKEWVLCCFYKRDTLVKTNYCHFNVKFKTKPYQLTKMVFTVATVLDVICTITFFFTK